MPRIPVVVSAMLLTTAAAAFAARGYKQGPYAGGDGSRGNLIFAKHPSILIDIKGSQFGIVSFVLPEHCSNGAAAPAVFVGNGLVPGNPLSGPIHASGNFSANYVAAGGRGKTTIHGAVHGKRGTVTVRDQGPATSQPRVKCQGSRTFHLKWGRVG